MTNTNPEFNQIPELSFNKDSLLLANKIRSTEIPEKLETTYHKIVDKNGNDIYVILFDFASSYRPETSSQLVADYTIFVKGLPEQDEETNLVHIYKVPSNMQMISTLVGSKSKALASLGGIFRGKNYVPFNLPVTKDQMFVPIVYRLISFVTNSVSRTVVYNEQNLSDIASAIAAGELLNYLYKEI